MQDTEFTELEENEAPAFKGEIVLVETVAEEPKNTMDQIIDEADEKNKKAMIEDLQELGESYEYAENRLKEAKLSIKSILEDAKDRGISKTMLETYVSLHRMSTLGKKAIFIAVVDDGEAEGDLDE